jgi:hypothetical protein
MRFNRLVLLQPHYWPTSGEAFGDSIEKGRLVYLMFFMRGQPSGQAGTCDLRLVHRLNDLIALEPFLSAFAAEA